MKKLLFILPILFACSTEEIESMISPGEALQTLAFEECEDLTADNGIRIDSCQIEMGGLFNEDIYLDSYTGKHFSVYSIENPPLGAFADLRITQDESSFSTYRPAIGASLIASRPDEAVIQYGSSIVMRVTSTGIIFELPSGKRLKFTGIVSSPVGLTSGMVYRDNNGFLKIIP